MRDRDAKGRSVIHRGEEHGNSKLSERDVRIIKTSSKPGRLLASRFHVNISTVNRIRRGKAWAHVS